MGARGSKKRRRKRMHWKWNRYPTMEDQKATTHRSFPNRSTTWDSSPDILSRQRTSKYAQRTRKNGSSIISSLLRNFTVARGGRSRCPEEATNCEERTQQSQTRIQFGLCSSARTGST